MHCVGFSWLLVLVLLVLVRKLNLFFATRPQATSNQGLTARPTPVVHVNPRTLAPGAWRLEARRDWYFFVLSGARTVIPVSLVPGTLVLAACTCAVQYSSLVAACYSTITAKDAHFCIERRRASHYFLPLFFAPPASGASECVGSNTVERKSTVLGGRLWSSVRLRVSGCPIHQAFVLHIRHTPYRTAAKAKSAGEKINDMEWYKSV